MCALISIRSAKKPAWNASKEPNILGNFRTNSHRIFNHLTLPTAATEDTVTVPVPDTITAPVRNKVVAPIREEVAEKNSGNTRRQIFQ